MPGKIEDLQKQIDQFSQSKVDVKKKPAIEKLMKVHPEVKQKLYEVLNFAFQYNFKILAEKNGFKQAHITPTWHSQYAANGRFKIGSVKLKEHL